MSEGPRLAEDPTSDASSSVVEEGDPGATGSPPSQEIPLDPDEAVMEVEGEIPADAIFSPDDPISRVDTEPGVVTGIGGNTDDEAVEGGLVWELRSTAHLLGSLARSLREQGLEALRVHPDTEPMDAMLRSFVAGYLVGRMHDLD